MNKPGRRHTLDVAEPLPSPISARTFKAEVLTWAGRINVEPGEIHLVGMSRKWASCSARGRVTFDTGLLQQPKDFRRQVIIHELLHLKVPNHGRLFSALLRMHVASADDASGQDP
jgi:predicted metal-dependent hydrolase